MSEQKILCFASEPAKVPGFWSRPQYNPDHTIVTGYVVLPGVKPPHLKNPCAGGKLDTLQELYPFPNDAISESISDTINNNPGVQVSKGIIPSPDGTTATTDPKPDNTDPKPTDDGTKPAEDAVPENPLCQAMDKKPMCVATEPVNDP